MLEGYATVQEMAEKWGLNERTVQTMCATGKIEGLTKFGRSWAISKDTENYTAVGGYYRPFDMLCYRDISTSGRHRYQRLKASFL